VKGEIANGARKKEKKESSEEEERFAKKGRRELSGSTATFVHVSNAAHLKTTR
jgi:hypothetical protein